MELYSLRKISVLCFMSCFLLGCAATKNRQPKQVVPILININTDEHQLSPVNFNVYAFKVIDRLEDFNEVDLDLVDEADSATIILNINIDRFFQLPPERRVSRRIFRRNIQVGTNTKGKAIYQTITASADIVQTRIRTSAFFDTRMVIKGTPGKTFERGFSENMNIDNVYVTNIQGDSRAVDPSVYSAAFPPMEPIIDDVLLALSDKEMLDRLSREIRSYYSK